MKKAGSFRCFANEFCEPLLSIFAGRYLTENLWFGLLAQLTLLYHILVDTLHNLRIRLNQMRRTRLKLSHQFTEIKS